MSRLAYFLKKKVLNAMLVLLAILLLDFLGTISLLVNPRSFYDFEDNESCNRATRRLALLLMLQCKAHL
jgi:hypothetical protein